jgi:TctA family transporter
MLDGILQGLSTAFLPINLVLLFVGCFAGTFIGMLPGLGPVSAIALMIPITYGFDPSSGLILMAGVYYGAVFVGPRRLFLSMLLVFPVQSQRPLMDIQWRSEARPVKRWHWQPIHRLPAVR